MAKQKAIDDYTLGKTLGEGRYGKVKVGHNIHTGKKVAIKILTKANIKSDEDLLRIQRETKILTALHHENIIQVYEILETPHQIFIIMEYAEGGDLYSYLVAKRGSSLTIEDALPYFRQMMSAMLYCHARFVVHRDLKPENVLLDPTLKKVKIADFGFSRTFSPGFDSLQTSCGSLYYAAPEILEGKKYVGPEVDVWSLGVILYVMLTGEMPFEGSNDHELARNIKRGIVRQGPIASCDPVHGHQIQSLINSMLTVDPSKRAKLRDIQLNPVVWLDRPLLASLALPIAKKLAYTQRREQPTAPPLEVTRLQASALRQSGNGSPSLKRSFSAELGPSPLMARANPAPVNTPSAPPSVTLGASQQNRPSLIRQSSGSSLFATPKMIRHSQLRSSTDGTTKEKMVTKDGMKHRNEEPRDADGSSASQMSHVPVGGFSFPSEDFDSPALPPPQNFPVHPTNDTVVTSRTSAATTTATTNTTKRDESTLQDKSMDLVDKLHLDKLKDFLPDFITRKRSPTQ